MGFSFDNIESKTLMDIDSECMDRYLEYRFVRGMSSMQAIEEIGLQPESISAMEYHAFRNGRPALDMCGCF